MNPNQGRPIRKLAVAVVCAAASLGSILVLDARFERADLRHAVEIVTGYHPHGQRETLPVLMARAHGARAREVACEGQVTSSLRGTVRVTCALQRDPLYRFDVDLGRVAIHPADAPTRRFLASLTPGG